MANKLRGRTKITHNGPLMVSLKTKGVRKPKVSAALSGRTKETHGYLLEMSNKRKGQTKTNCLRVFKQSETKNKLPPEVRKHIVVLRNEGKTFKQISETLNVLGYNVNGSYVARSYRREPKSETRIKAKISTPLLVVIKQKRLDKQKIQRYSILAKSCGKNRNFCACFTI